MHDNTTNVLNNLKEEDIIYDKDAKRKENELLYLGKDIIMNQSKNINSENLNSKIDENIIIDNKNSNFKFNKEDDLSENRNFNDKNREIIDNNDNDKNILNNLNLNLNNNEDESKTVNHNPIHLKGKKRKNQIHPN